MTEQDDPEIQEAPVVDERDNSEEGKHRRAIFSVQVDVVVSVGQARPVIVHRHRGRTPLLLKFAKHTSIPMCASACIYMEVRTRVCV